MYESATCDSITDAELKARKEERRKVKEHLEQETEKIEERLKLVVQGITLSIQETPKWILLQTVKTQLKNDGKTDNQDPTMPGIGGYWLPGFTLLTTWGNCNYCRYGEYPVKL